MDERLGPSDGLGVAWTVGDLISRLSNLDPTLPIKSHIPGIDSNGIALAHHAFVDPSEDYVSFGYLR